VSAKKNTTRVTILNEEYAVRTDTSPEHAHAVAEYLDAAIRRILASGAVVESNRAIVLAALQVTGELFDSRASIDATNQSITDLSEFVRPLLPPSKRAHG
jgi:cell division protein ZapA (FtsZ GTPase activity inhibitor)